MASTITTLRDELDALSTLVDLMKQEQQCLVAADTDGLNLVTPQKAQHIAQLGALSAQRHAQLQAAGFAADDGAMEGWLAASKDAQAGAQWQTLLDKTREAKELNRVNGMLINKQMQHTKTLIDAMRTSANAPDTAVYGPSGQAAPAGPSRRYVVG